MPRSLTRIGTLLLCLIAIGCSSPEEKTETQDVTPAISVDSTTTQEYRAPDSDGLNRTASGSIDNGEVSFKLDGADWKSGPPGHPEMKYEEDAFAHGGNMVRVEAYAADGSSISLQIFVLDGIEPGTYPLDNSNMRGFYKTADENGPKYITDHTSSNPGSFTITELTSEGVKGSFAFPMRNSANEDDIRQVTDGSFDVSFARY